MQKLFQWVYAKPKLVWIVLLFAIGLAIRLPSVPQSFDTSDKVQHVLSAMNLHFLPWWTSDFRGNKLSRIATHPYGVLMPIYYGWVSILNMLSIPLSEKTLLSFVSVLGALIPVWAFLIFTHFLILPEALLGALIFSLWHVNVFRSLTAFSAVLTFGVFALLGLIYALVLYVEQPTKKRALFVLCMGGLHFLSCQTAVLFLPVWFGFLLWKRNWQLKPLWKDGIIPGGLVFMAVLIAIFVLSVVLTGNLEGTVIGKLFSRNEKLNFAPFAAINAVFSGMGWLSSALIVASLFFWSFKLRSGLPILKLLVAGLGFYWFGLSMVGAHRFHALAYAYDMQAIFFLFFIFVFFKAMTLLSVARKFRYSLIVLIIGIFSFELVYSIHKGWLQTDGLFGIEREHGVHSDEKMKALGVVIRELYSEDRALFTDEKPMLSSFYFGGIRKIYGYYDASERQLRDGIFKAYQQKALDLFVIDSKFYRSIGFLKRGCLDVALLDTQGHVVKLIVTTGLSGAALKCAPTRRVQINTAARLFNVRFQTIDQILGRNIPYPYPQYLSE